MDNKQNAFILFKTEDEKISVDVRFEEETYLPIPGINQILICLNVF